MTELAAFLQARRDAQTELLRALVRTPADNPPGDCAPVAGAVAPLLERLGFAVERHPVPAELARANGMVSCTNLVVRHRFAQAGPTLALSVHGDVVPPGEGWTTDPYGAEIRDGWLYGRGAAVSKSDIVTYAYALLALAEAGHGLRGALELHVTFDEEVGGAIGPKYLLDQGITRPDAAIAAGFAYAVTIAHDGVLHLEAELRGRSAHAAKPHTGVDALEAATGVLRALYGWRGGLAARASGIAGIGAPQLTIGTIRGGINTNVVPDLVVLRMDRRIVPEESADAAEAELRAVIGEAARAYPEVGLTLRRIMAADPLLPTPASRRLGEIVARHASRVMGEPVGMTGVPLYTDARHYAAAGIPVVLYGAGPRSIEEANAHRADERVPLADLHRATEAVALAAAEFLRG